MNVELKPGSLSNFFSSAKETAKEIDEKRKVTRKNIIWIDPVDLISILKPESKACSIFTQKKKSFFL